MPYRSVLAIVAAALSIVFSTEAAARSALDSAVQLAQEQNSAPGYKLQPASLALQPNPTTLRAVSGQTVSLDPDRATKSAAYKWEAGFLLLSAIDAAETISCL